MKLFRTGIGALLAFLTVAVAGCDSMQETVAPEQTSAAERGERGQGPPSGDDEADGATVYVVHGINGTDLGEAEALPVDVQVDGNCVLTGVEFRDIEGPLTLPEDDYDLAVRIAAEEPCTGPVAVEADDVPLEEGDNVSIAAHLNADGEPTLTPFTNDVSAEPGRTRISARHAANFGAVDLVVDGSKPFTGLTNGNQVGDFLRPGEHTVAITPAGSMTRVFELTTDFEPFVLYAAYAVGSPGNDTFEVLLQTIEVGPRAEGDDDDEDDEDDRDDDEEDDDEEEEDDEDDDEEDEGDEG